MQYKTRSNSDPNGKPRVFFCSHWEDHTLFFPGISDEILQRQNCAVWYLSPGEAYTDEVMQKLKEMQLLKDKMNRLGF